jgi:hypothetical protein
LLTQTAGMPNTVAIVGHSHSGCVLAALAAGPPYWEAPEGLQVRGVNLAQLVPQLGLQPRDQTLIEPNAAPRVHPAVAAEVDRLFEMGTPVQFVSMLGGNGHNIVGLIRHEIPFDFVLPEAPDLPLEAGAQLLPYGVMRTLLERRVQFERATLVAFRHQYQGPFIHLESPPPPRDDQFVATSLDEFFKSRPVGPIVSAALRYKLWRLHSTIVERSCHELGITFVRTPAEACDPDGFLDRKAYGNATHANAWYGGRVLQQIARLVLPPRDDRRAA